ncbi:hypothetical protein FN846DRAFT_924704 [Sphaerosporella brunnea]|uniref:25S rRNA (uridine-N(3))-methyltransferase BMT5-like domain-containing protein n=1 Tax=Sphaerosporella brunnea TaxID=1250544 RepID=A0A5J5FCZ2_9PEZI|nr:hypothetical protein FN846DRAFT_924704 [Sphaerosporella brunnea]
MSKKRKHDNSSNPRSRPNKKSKAPPPTNPKAAPKKQHSHQQNQRPSPPFSPSDRVLLVGEGDFSFSLSLKRCHKVRKIFATSYDSAEEVLRKYPQAAENIPALLSTSESGGAEKDEIEAALEGWDSDSGRIKSEDNKPEYEVHHSIDATALLKRRIFSKSSRRYDKIVFQFPHIGGATKDQDRQVRANQQLLLGFFKSAAPLLTPNMGNVIVTLFEGMPYELWNIRALAKEAGLVTKVSFAFEAKEYEGYKHVRTLGNIEGGGGWKGEDRKSRMYIFGTGAAGAGNKPAAAAGNRKRKAQEESDDDD